MVLGRFGEGEGRGGGKEGEISAGKERGEKKESRRWNREWQEERTYSCHPVSSLCLEYINAFREKSSRVVYHELGVPVWVSS